MTNTNDEAADPESTEGPPSRRSGRHWVRVPESLLVTAMRAVGRVTGVIFVVDCDQRRIVCMSAADSLPPTVLSKEMEQSIMRLAEACIERDLTPSPLPSLPGLPDGTVLSVAPLGHRPELGDHRLCAVQAVFGPARHGALKKLSSRERDIARLLAAGHSSMNVGARYGIATSTVRTYVRRIYTKLGVFNRVDLVRKVLGGD